MTNYLHVDTKAKLLQEAEREILEQYEAELLDKEDTGAAALMRDDKVLHLPDLLLGLWIAWRAKVTDACLLSITQGTPLRQTRLVRICLSQPALPAVRTLEAVLLCVGLEFGTCQPTANLRAVMLACQPTSHLSVFMTCAESRPGAHVPAVLADTQGPGAGGGHLQEACGGRGHQARRPGHRGPEHPQGEGRRCSPACQAGSALCRLSESMTGLQKAACLHSAA